MQELIKVTEKEGQQLVSARELHEFLDVGRDFSTWINEKVEKYGFEEGEDFTTFLGKSNGGRPTKEYAIKIDMAKELSMLQNNEKGKQARKYFIECEKKLKELPVMSEMEMISKIASSQHETLKRVETVESSVQKLENTMTIDSAKQRNIQKTVAIRVYNRIEELCDLYIVNSKENRSKLFANIYRDLKNKFAVSSYKDIRVVDYDKAIQFIENWIEDSNLLEVE